LREWLAAKNIPLPAGADVCRSTWCDQAPVAPSEQSADARLPLHALAALGWHWSRGATNELSCLAGVMMVPRPDGFEWSAETLTPVPQPNSGVVVSLILACNFVAPLGVVGIVLILLYTGLNKSSYESGPSPDRVEPGTLLYLLPFLVAEISAWA
jgi:hypothetical protein